MSCVHASSRRAHPSRRDQWRITPHCRRRIEHDDVVPLGLQAPHDRASDPARAPKHSDRSRRPPLAGIARCFAGLLHPYLGTSILTVRAAPVAPCAPPDDNDQRILAQQQLLKIDDLAISMFTPCGARMTDEPVESNRVSVFGRYGFEPRIP
jgi:hypothetical protein